MKNPPVHKNEIMTPSHRLTPAPAAFAGLGPEQILLQVEIALGRKCTNLCRPYNSYINRVFELQEQNGQGLVVKFYRPGRWSKQAIVEEHAFLQELAHEELPVIAPLILQNGSTLTESNGLTFAVFPKKGGRCVDEFSEEQWLSVGRLLGRMHMVGARRPSPARNRLHPSVTSASQLEYILRSGLLQEDLQATYEKICTEIIETISPLFASGESIRIHGDCHRGNLIDRPGESFFILDFDDMATGPPIQDLWMLLPGPVEECALEVDLFREGYETFRPFRLASLALIEPLRAMRFIHYTAWCAYQVIHDGKTAVVPDFGSRHYWQTEIQDLKDQLQRIRDYRPSFLQ